MRGFLEGKKVVLVDDSVIRGTTLKKIVGILRNSGAREVHLRISAPPSIASCHYGIDTPTTGELIAANHTVEEICSIMGADSLGYLSLEGLHDVSSRHIKRGICDACFSNRYPIPIDGGGQIPQLSLFRDIEEE